MVQFFCDNFAAGHVDGDLSGVRCHQIHKIGNFNVGNKAGMAPRNYRKVTASDIGFAADHKILDLPISGSAFLLRDYRNIPPNEISSIMAMYAELYSRARNFDNKYQAVPCYKTPSANYGLWVYDALGQSPVFEVELHIEHPIDFIRCSDMNHI